MMPRKRIAIRPAEISDCADVLALWKRVGVASSVADNTTALKRRLRRDRDLFLVALHGQCLVGSLIAGWDGWRATMARLAVDPDYRRERIARRLVARAEARLRARGAKRIGALVFADNDRARRFWRAAGYVPDSTITRFAKNL